MENRSSGWEVLGGLALGAAGGFLVGLLVAPRTGSETREVLGGSMQDVRERTQDMLENVRGNTESMLDTTRQAIEEKMALLNEAIEAGRRAAEYKRAELIENDNP
ncbi:MAG TPA: YtxH domain-containing protein [Oscillatoriaceae cyanobacterium]